jgi:predicted  nucleic acid-binding Zn-ribbon protein
MSYPNAIDWYVTNCITCDCEFAFSARLKNRRLQDKASFYCPNGHSQCFTESEADRLRRERDRLKQDAARLNDEIAEQKRRAEEAEKKLLTAKRRAAAGLCPCCNRTFQNVQKHMATKHKNVVPLQKVAS